MAGAANSSLPGPVNDSTSGRTHSTSRTRSTKGASNVPQQLNPLAGVRVLEIAHYIAGPYAAAVLGNHGADVIKIERPGGEPGRRALPLTPEGESLYYAAYNRNKRSIVLDLGEAADRPLLDGLIEWADVVLTNFAPGVPERLGFGWERVHALNPRAVMIHITGFGSWSRARDFLSFDSISQAMSGLASMTGDADGPPCISSVFICDHVTALHATIAATSGLRLRDRTGEGAFTEVTMQRAAASLLGAFVPQADLLGEVPTRTGNRSPKRFTNVFATNDGFVVVSPNTPRMWANLCTEIDHPEWGSEEIARTRRHILDEAFRAKIDQAIATWAKNLSGDVIMRRLQALGVPCGMIRTIDEVHRDDTDLDLKMFAPVNLAEGTRTLIAGPVFEFHSDSADQPHDEEPATPRIRRLDADRAAIIAELHHRAASALRDG